MALTKAHYAVYGDVVIPRGYCPRCKTHAFIQDGKIGCCDRPFNQSITTSKQMLDAKLGRKGPSTSYKKRLLEDQDFRCLYCERRFGSTVYRDGKAVTLRVQYDHWSPYVYSINNSNANFVAACHVCNGIKSAFIFDTLEEAKIAIQARWEAKGYKDMP